MNNVDMKKPAAMEVPKHLTLTALLSASFTIVSRIFWKMNIL